MKIFKRLQSFMNIVLIILITCAITVKLDQWDAAHKVETKPVYLTDARENTLTMIAVPYLGTKEGIRKAKQCRACTELANYDASMAKALRGK